MNEYNVTTKTNLIYWKNRPKTALEVPMQVSDRKRQFLLT